MACNDNNNNNNNHNHNRSRRNFGMEERQICCCNNKFTFDLTEIGNNQFTLTVTPCSIPTSVFDVATITVKENSCNQIEYFQATINTDPVITIQDCSLRDLLCRAITAYFSDINFPTCNTSRRRNFSIL